MKKLVSLGIVSAMVATMAAPTLAVKEVSGDINDIKAYILEDQATNLASAKEVTPSNTTFQGLNCEKSISITARNSHTYKIVFGLSKTCPFGTGSASTKPVSQTILKANNSNPVVKGSNELSGSAGVTISKGKIAKVNAGSGDYLNAQGVTIVGSNSSSTERYSVYPITLKDANNNTTTIKLCITAPAFDKDDTSDGEADTNDDGFREFAGGQALYNGYTIGSATLKEMQGKGNYKFTGAKGVDILASVSKATLDAGKTSFNASASLDANLDARYNADKNGKVFKLSVGMFPAESRQVNIRCDSQAIIDLLTTDFCDKVIDGVIKKLYVYPIDAKGYESLANASGNDGLIDTDKVITATVTDSKISFTLPKDVTEVMISQKEIDTTKLAAIPGVSVPETTSATNEITAPVIDTTSETAATSEVAAPVATATAPTVVSSPVLSSVPAGSGAAQNTGASDVISVAIALAAISMAAAGVVASKKF